MEQLVRGTKGVVIEIAYAGMEKYNQLYSKFNNLNNFPKERELQTFLLSKDNMVIAVGNPHYTRAIKDIYLKRITQVIENDRK